ncbi:TonB-dependent siderophore receptor [Litoribrevibacter euphylliae]|uniref:TonB-dependent siderophore receptor n=1 Tax=Litoribrevibacter euphylliae TaxID=1834034 RepID=A0ABV7HPU1_9GAMM
MPVLALPEMVRADASNLAGTSLSQLKMQFNIPAGSLETALNTLGRDTGILLSYSTALTTGKVSQGLEGLYTVEDALNLLLSDSGLRATRLDDGSYALEIAELSVFSEQEVQVIYGTVLSRYEFDEAESATGFVTDVDSLPRSVQVLPEQLILDQNATRLTDVLLNAAGVTRTDGFGGSQDDVIIRGMDNNHLFVDGAPVSSRTRMDVANIERVEVVNGPASVLHGQVSPGGLINIITKKPQKDSAHSVQADWDEHGRQKLAIDSTGSLSDKFQYRVIIAREDSESFREVKTEEGATPANTEIYSISPSISFTPDDQNTFTLRLGYSDQNVPIDRGTVAVDDGNGNISVARLPIERRLGSEFSERDGVEKRVQFDFDHEFDNGWKNQFKAGYYEKSFDEYQARPTYGLNGVPANFLQILGLINSGSVQSNGLLLRTADSNLNTQEDDLFISNSISGDFFTGDVEHRLYVGANYTVRGAQRDNGFALQDITGVFSPAPLYSLDLDIVDIYESTRPTYNKRAQTVVHDIDDTYTEYGVSIQNISYLTDRLNLLAGLRYDHFELESETNIFYGDGPFGGTFVPLATPEHREIDSSNDNISAQLGALYELTDGISLYGSFSESFLPNYPDVTSSSQVSDRDFDPEEASQFEIGIKSSFMDDKLRVTASVYELTRENVLTVDNNFVARLNGEEKSKGLELSATMQFIPGLNVLASYTHIDAEIVDDNDDNKDNEGNAPKSVPDNKARVWGSYEVQQGKLAGLGVGFGLEYADERQGDDENRFTLPSYTIYDTAAWYYVPFIADSKLRLQAGVKNLFDKEYYPASINAFRINVGEPRTAYMTARLDF